MHAENAEEHIWKDLMFLSVFSAACVCVFSVRGAIRSRCVREAGLASLVDRNQTLDDHHVTPNAVELRMPLVDADLAKPVTGTQRA